MREQTLFDVVVKVILTVILSIVGAYLFGTLATSVATQTLYALDHGHPHSGMYGLYAAGLLATGGFGTAAFLCGVSAVTYPFVVYRQYKRGEQVL
jgi:hypothetical protein